jgi:1-phosphofructokinase
MIYTISFNPCIDYTFYLSRIRYDDINRIEETRVDAGGKGLNVARMLSVLGSDCEALTFLGGRNGDILKTLLDGERIRYRYVSTKGDVRSVFNFFAGKKNSVLRFNEKGPFISEKEEEAFFHLFDDIKPEKGDVISISGSLPLGLQKATYRTVIENVREKGVLTVLDADGDVLREGIKGKPDIIKPNLWELARATGTSITSFAILEKVLKNIINSGISTILLTLGEKGAILFSKNEFLYASAPPVKVQSTVGCGDTFLAGFLYSLSRSEKYEDCLRMAVSCGTAKVTRKGTGMPEKKDVMKILSEVKIKPIKETSTSFQKRLLGKGE